MCTKPKLKFWNFVLFCLGGVDCFVSETWSHYAALASLELTVKTSLAQASRSPSWRPASLCSGLRTDQPQLRTETLSKEKPYLPSAGRNCRVRFLALALVWCSLISFVSWHRWEGPASLLLLPSCTIYPLFRVLFGKSLVLCVLPPHSYTQISGLFLVRSRLLRSPCYCFFVLFVCVRCNTSVWISRAASFSSLGPPAAKMSYRKWRC